MNKIAGMVRRCIEDYNMVKAGDRIAVGVSGGKDSMLLLHALASLKRYFPVPFELTAITLDMGFEGMDFGPIADRCRTLGIEHVLVKTQLKQIIFDDRKEKNPCSMCAKMRRGHLSAAAIENGCNKVALGHNFDDAVETFLMSLIYEGRISCFQPVTNLDRTGVYQIRPMVYVGEGMVRETVKRKGIVLVENNCPANGYTKRQEIKELAAELNSKYPGLKNRIFSSMQRFPLQGWGVDPSRLRRPLPE